MEETNKILLSIVAAVLVALFGYAIKGFFGLVIGFVCTILTIWIFSIMIQESKE